MDQEAIVIEHLKLEKSDILDMKNNNEKSVLLIKLLLFAILLNCCWACKNDRQEQFSAKKNTNSSLNADSLAFIDFRWSKNTDSLFLSFRLVNKTTNKKIFWGELDNTNIIKIEEPASVLPPVFNDIKLISGLEKRISRDGEFTLLIDRSQAIKADDIERIKETVHKIVKVLPDSTVYISFMDDKVTDNKLICEKNLFDFDQEFYISNSNKNLYHALEYKFSELSNKIVPKKNTVIRYLIVFTDGKVNANDIQTPVAIANFYDALTKADKNSEVNKVIIHTFRYGSDTSNDDTFEHICKTRKTDAIGDFYPADKASDIIFRFREFENDLSADYELILSNPSGKIYNGQELLLSINIEKEGKEAIGIKKYAIGSKERPVTTGVENGSEYFAIFWGLVVLIVVFLIIQIVIPYITHKLDNFEKRHVINFEPDEEILETCSVCQDIFTKGEKVVVKCNHKTHWECWKENDYKCVEFGQNCPDGIQHYFDKEQPFNLKKSPYYLKWALSGMIGGLLTWVIYKLCLDFNPTLFNQFTLWLLDHIYSGEYTPEVQAGFIRKTGGLLLTGILLGFILTLLFSYINEFRQKNSKIIMAIIYRALIGSFVGFISFLIGTIICISLGAYANNMWIDWIPWLLFGMSIGLCLSVNTTIKWQHALSGGIISGVLSFILLYSTHFFGSLGVLFGFMFCSAGLGISIVAVHHRSQKYFLRYKCDKANGEIAIHKWMSVAGGSNEVSIGKAKDCVIQMNWDTSRGIHDKQVKLFIDKKRNMPVLKVINNDMSFDGRQPHVNNEYMLKDGVKFRIGNTDFQYIEKR